MQPNDTQDDRSLTVPSRDDAAPLRTPDRDAAARLMREQIDRLYETDTTTTPQPKPVAASPYQQNHSDQKAHDAASHDAQWNKYHSAWQQYYQQYYERYYLTQLRARTQPVADTPTPEKSATVLAMAMVTAGEPEAVESLTKDQAVHELRDQLIGQVRVHGDKVRSSRHFMPIMSAIVVALVFLILQYNRVITAQVQAYVSPGAIDPQNVIVDPSSSAKVGPEPKLVIPKLNVEAPIVYGVGSLADGPVQKALKDGVVHYPIPGADSTPGQQGNTVILGHSSNDVFDDGKYKFIFVQLEKLQPGDTFYIHHDSVRYTYRIREKKVILPTEVSSLIINDQKPLATLVTCVPIGTALKRLVVVAEQISPDPTKATTHTSTQGNQPVNLPGYSPTFLERLFGN